MTPLAANDSEPQDGDGYLVWALAVSLGALVLILYLQFAARPFMLTIAAVLWIISMIGVAGIVQLHEASRMRRRTVRVGWAAGGAGYLAAAAMLIANPLLGNAAIALALSAALVFAAFARGVVAAATGRGRPWLALSSAATIVVALAIGFGWPFPLTTRAVQLLALDLLVLGTAMILSRARGVDPAS